MAIAFERATEIAARQLARCRTGWDDLDAEPTANEKLLAGHIVGALWGANLLNTDGEEWIAVESESSPVSSSAPLAND